MAKIKKVVTMEPETFDYLVSIKTQRGLRSYSAALDAVVQEHQRNNSEFIQACAGVFMESFENKYKDMFTRMRLGINTADRNSQVLIEILNSMIIGDDRTDFYATDTLESDIVKESKNAVKDRIARYKQIKDNKKY